MYTRDAGSSSSTGAAPSSLSPWGEEGVDSNKKRGKYSGSGEMISKLGSGSGGGDAPAAPITPPSPGVSKLVKLSLLIVLCLQNAVYTMLRRYR